MVLAPLSCRFKPPNAFHAPATDAAAQPGDRCLTHADNALFEYAIKKLDLFEFDPGNDPSGNNNSINFADDNSSDTSVSRS